MPYRDCHSFLPRTHLQLPCSQNWTHRSLTCMHQDIAIFERVEVQLFARKGNPICSSPPPYTSWCLDNRFHNSICYRDTLRCCISNAVRTILPPAQLFPALYSPKVRQFNFRSVHPSPPYPPLSLSFKPPMPPLRKRSSSHQDELSSLPQPDTVLLELTSALSQLLPPSTKTSTSQQYTAFPTQNESPGCSLSPFHPSPSH